MKLVNIQTLIYVGNEKDLLKCHLCHQVSPQYVAVEDNWVKDVDRNNIYYCPECERFFINKLDDTRE